MMKHVNLEAVRERERESRTSKRSIILRTKMIINNIKEYIAF